MIGKIVAAEIGRRVAGRHNGVKGLLIGAAAPWLLRRALTPAGIVIGGALIAKRLYDRKRDSDRAALRREGVTRTALAKSAPSTIPVTPEAPTAPVVI